MKKVNKILPALAVVMIIGCANMSDKNDAPQENEGQKNEYNSAKDAAMAAKEDMVKAMEQVDFGVDRNKLSDAVPGEPITTYMIKWDELLNASQGSTPAKLSVAESIVIVPLQNGEEVVTVISLDNRKGSYKIAGIGDQQIAYELDAIRRVDNQSTESTIRIYKVPNLNAIIYEVDKTQTYYTSYSNNPIRKGMKADDIIPVLKVEAQEFQKNYGDQLKEGKLVN